MLNPLVPKFRPDLSAHLKGTGEKQVPAKLKRIVVSPSGDNGWPAVHAGVLTPVPAGSLGSLASPTSFWLDTEPKAGQEPCRRRVEVSCTRPPSNKQ